MTTCKERLAIVTLLVLGGGGCATWAHGTAPAPGDGIYVVGQRQSTPTIWLCPSTPGKGDCQKVEVTEVSK